MKKFFSLIVALAFVVTISGFAFAGLAWSANDIDIDQTAGATYNSISNVKQTGTGQHIDVDQIATTTNNVVIEQGGTSQQIDILQSGPTPTVPTAAGGLNTATIYQQSGTSHIVDIIQTAETGYNSITVNQAGTSDGTTGKKAIINQQAKINNNATINQVSAGGYTKHVGTESI